MSTTTVRTEGDSAPPYSVNPSSSFSAGRS